MSLSIHCKSALETCRGPLGLRRYTCNPAIRQRIAGKLVSTAALAAKRRRYTCKLAIRQQIARKPASTAANRRRYLWVLSVPPFWWRLGQMFWHSGVMIPMPRPSNLSQLPFWPDAGPTGLAQQIFWAQPLGQKIWPFRVILRSNFAQRLPLGPAAGPNLKYH